VKDKDVAQEQGMYGGERIVKYAVDAAGHYVKVLSKGWAPANTANEMALSFHEAEAERQRQLALLGQASPLAFYMAHAKMDEALLADYAGFSRRKVRYHLTPEGFQNLSAEELDRYAKALGLTREQLQRVDEGETKP
jgi:hypothetical protein